jgi:hypothetical protein
LETFLDITLKQLENIESKLSKLTIDLIDIRSEIKLMEIRRGLHMWLIVVGLIVLAGWDLLITRFTQ